MTRLTFRGGPEDGRELQVLPEGLKVAFVTFEPTPGEIQTHAYECDWTARTATHTGIVTKAPKTIPPKAEPE